MDTNRDHRIDRAEMKQAAVDCLSFLQRGPPVLSMLPTTGQLARLSFDSEYETLDKGEWILGWKRRYEGGEANTRGGEERSACRTKALASGGGSSPIRRTPVAE